jgi:hypothetical protein
MLGWDVGRKGGKVPSAPLVYHFCFLTLFLWVQGDTFLLRKLTVAAFHKSIQIVLMALIGGP